MRPCTANSISACRNCPRPAEPPTAASATVVAEVRAGPVAAALPRRGVRLASDSEVPPIDFLRRLLGGPEAASPTDADEGADSDAAAPDPTPAPASDTVRPAGAACPSCATILDPPPTKRRLCPNCRQPIVVRQIDGRTAYLTEAAVAVFVAERQRETDERAWTTARRTWLQLAGTVDVPVARRAKLASAAPSAAVVEASRVLYMSAAERAVREARRGKRWADVGRIRRAQAAAVYLDAGSPVPPPDDVVAMHREGMAGVLRAHAAYATERRARRRGMLQGLPV